MKLSFSRGEKKREKQGRGKWVLGNLINLCNPTGFYIKIWQDDNYKNALMSNINTLTSFPIASLWAMMPRHFARGHLLLLDSENPTLYTLRICVGYSNQSHPMFSQLFIYGHSRTLLNLDTLYAHLQNTMGLSNEMVGSSWSEGKFVFCMIDDEQITKTHHTC